MPGGFVRPVRIGDWLRQRFATGQEFWGHQLYRMWATAMKSIPLKGETKEDFIYIVERQRRPGFKFTTYLKRRRLPRRRRLTRDLAQPTPVAELLPKPRTRRWSARKVCSYGKFMTYLSILKRRGLIRAETEPRAGRIYLRVARASDPEEWLNLQGPVRGE